MESKIKFYNFGKGWGWIENPNDSVNAIYFHISNVFGELSELFDAKKIYEEPIIFDTQISKQNPNRLEAINIKLDLSKRSIGYIKLYENGYGWIEDFFTKETYFLHHTKFKGADKKFIAAEKTDPVIFTKSKSENRNEAIDVVIVDTRCDLEKFADFDDFNQSLDDLKVLSEEENWDYINHQTGKIPVLASYINHTFDRIVEQNKIVIGRSSKDEKEYAYFNTGLVTSFQDEIYGYFLKVNTLDKSDQWHIIQPEYEFLEFNTDQSLYRKFFSETPLLATYFTEAEVRELVFDTSLNNGKIIIDREHIKNRKNRFPNKIANLDDEEFFDSVAKSIELAIRRIKRNYKTAIPHFYDGKIQFLLPLCMQTKKDADLALVVNKEESVYKAHTVLTLDQAYNNARLLAKPDREWLNP